MEERDFEWAMKEMKCGKKVWRSGWNGKGMFLFLISGNAWNFETDVDGVDGIDTCPFVCMKTAQSNLIPWLASQSDLLSSDWDSGH